MPMTSRLHHPATAPLLALLISGGLLCGAWFFQYVLGYAPCMMCFWQRHAHKAVIVLAALALIAALFEPRARKPLLLLTVLALLGSAGLGFFHMGVEYGWWEGPKGCTAVDIDSFKIDPNDPMAALNKPIKPPSCDKAVWHFLGLSMATWNGIVSLFGAGVTATLGFGKVSDNDET